MVKLSTYKRAAIEKDRDYLPSRRYPEAFPSLRVVKAVRGVCTGYDCLLWRDELGEPVGTASTKLLAPDKLQVNATIFATRHFGLFDVKFLVPLVEKRAGELRWESYAVCTCGRDVKVLIFKRHDWRCGKCQKLVNRSALVARPIRLYEQLAKVTQELGSGRRPNMHNSTYQRLLDERNWLGTELNGFRGRANSDHTNIISEEFVKLPTEWLGG